MKTRLSRCYSLLALPLIALLAGATPLALADDTPCANSQTGGSDDSGDDTCDGDTSTPNSQNNATSGGNPFNAYSGNVTRRITDLEINNSPGAYPLTWMRTHNTRSGQNAATIFGSGGNWKHNHQWLVVDSRDYGSNPSITIWMPDGGRFIFIRQSSDPTVWLPAANVGMRVDQAGNAFTLLDRTGRIVRFTRTTTGGVSYRVDSYSDAGGNFYQYTYDPAARLSIITDPAGHTLTLTYTSHDLSVQKKTTLADVPSNKPVGTWMTKTISNPQPHRYYTFEGIDDGWSSLSELEFYDENDQRVYGIPISAGGTAGHEAEMAFDGDPATYYRHPYRQYGYVGMDFGADNTVKVKKVRALVDYAHYPYRGGTIYALDTAPAVKTALASVTTDDGRSVSYQYTVAPEQEGGYEFNSLTLTRAVYGDGTQAEYAYSQLHPFTNPLLETARDPRFNGSAGSQIRYTYHPDAALGLIQQESSSTGQTLATLGATGSHTPQVTYPNTGVVKFKFSFTNGNLVLRPPSFDGW